MCTETREFRCRKNGLCWRHVFINMRNLGLCQPRGPMDFMETQPYFGPSPSHSVLVNRFQTEKSPNSPCRSLRPAPRPTPEEPEREGGAAREAIHPNMAPYFFRGGGGGVNCRNGPKSDTPPHVNQILSITIFSWP